MTPLGNVFPPLLPLTRGYYHPETRRRGTDQLIKYTVTTVAIVETRRRAFPWPKKMFGRSGPRLLCA